MIRLGDGWEIRGDDCGYTLQRRTTAIGKDGTEKELVKTVSYHRTLKECATSLCQKLQRKAVGNEETVMDWKTAVEELNKIHDTVTTAVNEG